MKSKMKKLLFIVSPALLFAFISCAAETEVEYVTVTQPATSGSLAGSSGEVMDIALSAAVPQENGYTGTKSNTKVSVFVDVISDCDIKKVI